MSTAKKKPYEAKRDATRDRALSNLVERSELETLLCSQIELESIVCLRAPEGMGKTTLLKRIARLYRMHGCQVIEESFEGVSPEDTAKIIAQDVDRCLTLQKKGQTVLVCDDVPPFDETVVEQVAALFRALKLGGAKSIFATNPDGEDLALALGLRCVGARELQVLPGDYAQWDIFEEAKSLGKVWTYTHGIPALCKALMGVRSLASLNTISGYEAALRTHLEHVLNDVQMEEERQLRLAMLLLGSGNLDELEDVCSRVDSDLLIYLHRDEPFFSVDLLSKTFECVAAEDKLLLDLLVVFASSQLSQQSELVRRVCWKLIGRKDFRRAGIIAERCLPEGDCRELALTWPIEFLNVGQVAFVKRAIQSSDTPSEITTSGKRKGAKDQNSQGVQKQSFEARVAKVAFTSLFGRKEAFDQIEFDLKGESIRQINMANQARMLFVARKAMMGETVDATEIEAQQRSDDELTHMLASHVFSLVCLLGGKPSECFRYLLIDGALRDGNSLASSMLCLDFDYARCRVGDIPNQDDEQRTRQAAEFALKNKLAGLTAYRNSSNFVLSALAGRAANTSVGEECLLHAERQGDKAIAAVLYLACSLCDLSKGRHTRAAVRAVRAKDIFESCSQDFDRLVNIAEFIQALTELELGAAEGLEELASKRLGFVSNFAMACKLLATNSKEDMTLAGNLLQKTGLDPSNIPLVRAVLRDCKFHEGRLEEILPASWGVDIKSFEESADAWFGVKEAGTRPIKRAKAKNLAGVPLLSVSMLGGFEAKLGDVRITDRMWGRRSVRTLLAMLCAMKNHEATRVDVIDLIWPEASYDRGRVNLYTSVSTLRRVLGGSPMASNYLDGDSGLLRLLPGSLYCDVDEFESLVEELRNSALSDVQVVNTAKRIQKIYGGDLSMPMGETSSMIEARRRSLQKDYQDALIMAAKAAYRASQISDAIWFSRLAYESDDVREDIIESYISVLMATGRVLEANQVFNAYNRKCKSLTGFPAAWTIRRLLDGDGINFEKDDEKDKEDESEESAA